MFYHNFKYSLKTLFKSKDLLFWTFIFPLILGTFFKLAFSNIEKSETFDVINIAIIDSSNYQDNKIYQEVFETLSDKNNENQVFNLEVTDLKEANSLLEEKAIIGYLEFLDDDIKITVKENGIDVSEDEIELSIENVGRTEYEEGNKLFEEISEEQMKDLELYEIKSDVRKVWRYEDTQNIQYYVDTIDGKVIIPQKFSIEKQE